MPYLASQREPEVLLQTVVHSSPLPIPANSFHEKAALYQPYGKRGLLIADIDLTEATGLLASRCKHI